MRGEDDEVRLHALGNVEDAAADGAGRHFDVHRQVRKRRGKLEQPDPRELEHLAITDRRPFRLQLGLHVPNDRAQRQARGKAAGDLGRDRKRVGPRGGFVGVHRDEDALVHRPLRLFGLPTEDGAPGGPGISVISPKALRRPGA